MRVKRFRFSHIARTIAVAASVSASLLLPVSSAVASSSSAPAASPAGSSLAMTRPGIPQKLFGIAGTPHTWIEGTDGLLHWIGDTSAQLKGLYPERDYDLSDPLGASLRASLARPT